jgi:hypothetical protein
LLAGTLHRLPPGVDLPPLYRRWCSQADRLLMEVEPAALEVSTLLPLTMERALQPPGGSLEADLGPVLFSRVGDRLAPLGLAPELLRQLRPWAALLLLSGRELERQGFDAAGVDQRLARCAAASGRPVEGLETAAAQLNRGGGLSVAAGHAINHHKKSRSPGHGLLGHGSPVPSFFRDRSSVRWLCPIRPALWRTTQARCCRRWPPRGWIP